MQMSQRVCYRHWVNCETLQREMPLESACWPHSCKNYLKRCGNQMFQSHCSLCTENLSWGVPNRLLFLYSWDMIILIYLFVLLWEEAHGWGFKNGIFHNSIWLGKKLYLLNFWLRMSLLWIRGEVNQSSRFFCSGQAWCFQRKCLGKITFGMSIPFLK